MRLKEGAEPKRRSFRFSGQSSFPPSPMVMNFEYWPKTKKPACSVKGHSLRDRVRSSLTRKVLGVEPLAAPPHREEPAEVAKASVSDAPWQPPWGGVSSMSHQEETPGEEPGHAAETASLGCPGCAMESSWKSWSTCPGIGKSGWKCKDRWMDGWQNGRMIIVTLAVMISYIWNMNSKSNDWVILVASFHTVLQDYMILPFSVHPVVSSAHCLRQNQQPDHPKKAINQHQSTLNWNSDMCCGVLSHHK